MVRGGRGKNLGFQTELVRLSCPTFPKKPHQSHSKQINVVPCHSLARPEFSSISGAAALVAPNAPRHLINSNNHLNPAGGREGSLLQAARAVKNPRIPFPSIPLFPPFPVCPIVPPFPGVPLISPFPRTPPRAVFIPGSFRDSLIAPVLFSSPNIYPRVSFCQ